MIISIIGSGAIGKTYGGLLALAGHQVHFLAHSEYDALLQAGSFEMKIKDIDATLHVNQFFVHNSSAALPLSDLVIIALKTTTNHVIPALISHCVHDKTVVLIIQNGIGCEEWISQFTGKSPIVCGIASIGAYRNGIDLDISFLGHLKLAPYGTASLDTCHRIAHAFQQAPVALPITIHNNYKEIRWSKLLWNIPFGALSIIFNISTHHLATEEPYRTIVYHLMNEISLIAKAEGIVLDKQLPQQLIEFTTQAGAYFPTIYRDYHEGKAIEKEYIYDHVLNIAKEHHCLVPFLTLIEKQLEIFLKIRDLKSKY